MNTNITPNTENLALDWNDTICTDSQEYVLLEEGDYVFTVKNFERAHFPGSSKLPPCNKAVLTLEVETSDGTAAVKHDLILCRSLEWRISAFFRCIGQKKMGERLVMDWNKVVGSRGRAHFKPRSYINRDGEERRTNDLDRFYDYDPAAMPEDKTPDWVKEADKAPEKSWVQGQF